MGLLSTTQMLTGIKNWVLGKLGDINALIPSQASSSNKLVDTNTMNSSIATATATHRGTYNLVTDLELPVASTPSTIAGTLAVVVSTADNNDYVFVQIPTADATPTQIARVDKYKYNGTAWAFEYTLNNSGYTAAQWAAINSGITSGKITEIDNALAARYNKSETDALLEDTPDFEEDASSAEELADDYAGLRQDIYQAVTDAQTATENAKADYVGDDNYVYHWDASQGKYVKTDKYVKGADGADGRDGRDGQDGAPGTTDYNDLENKPNLATVATSGSYNDLTNLPDLSDVDFVDDNSSDNPFA